METLDFLPRQVVREEPAGETARLYALATRYTGSRLRHQLLQVLIVHLLTLRVEVKPEEIHVVLRFVATSDAPSAHALILAPALERLANHQLVLLLVDQVHHRHTPVLPHQRVEVTTEGLRHATRLPKDSNLRRVLHIRRLTPFERNAAADLIMSE